MANEVHQQLRRIAREGAVEKASYDDFYLDITDVCRTGAPHACSLKDRIHVVGDPSLENVDACLLQGAHVGFPSPPPLPFK